jgi:predicted phage tail protein
MSGGTATSYVLEVGGAPGLANIAALIVGSTSFSYEPVPFGLYYLRVRARNGSGTSAPSNEVRVSIVEVPLPGPPIGLAFAVNGSSVTLSWQAPATGGSPSGYVLEAGSASGLSNLAVFPTSGPVTSQTFTGVPAGRYFVRVRAANAAGVSVPSAEVEIVVP